MYSKKEQIQKKCKNCNKVFYSNIISKIFCEDRCSYDFYMSKRRKPTIEKRCDICKKVFHTRKKRQIYCSNICYSKAMLIHSGRKSSLLNIPTATIGAISELTVANDLLKKGYEVYRPLSASCSADLLVERKKKIFKIEVRTGYTNLNGKVNCSFLNVRAPILAIVLKNGIIKYIDFISKNDFIF
jgi:predicted AAA+ superfamily ATPase